MNLRPWPDYLDQLLAKSTGKGVEGKEESLAAHTGLVLARLSEFIKLRPNLPRQLGEPRLWHYLYWATFLHDFGKAMPAFQAILRQDSDRKRKEAWLEQRQRHEVFSLPFIDWITDGLDEEERLRAIMAIVSHHRDAEMIAEIYDHAKLKRLHEQFEGMPIEHVQGLHQWLTTCGWPWAIELGLDQVGVKPVSFVLEPAQNLTEWAVDRISYWLQQYRHFIRALNRRYQPELYVPLITLRGMLMSADHSGSAHADPLPRIDFQVDDVITSRKIDWEKLYWHQRGLSEEKEGALEDEKALFWEKGSALLVAPTGSGKTEAALLWAACQKENNGYQPPRLFYTLPYQASMNAMMRRLKETFGKDFVEIQHGRALLATYRWLMEEGEHPKNAVKVARQRRNLARLHYPPVRVFSPYQMLKAMYRLKGYETQLTDYQDGLFIFDEIHAYEVKRLALILRTIAYLRRYYNARFLVMSATFPQLIREWLADALGETPTITASHKLYTKFQRHRICLVEGEVLDEVNLARIRAAALDEKKSVLVVCNIVARAQQVYDILSEQLTEAGIEIILLHGGFNMRDRLKKERIIRERTGADKPTGAPIILVTTQAVEVSLDIDLDTIYTEPAPLEALFQRFGRVNRRGKKGIVDVHVFTVGSEGQKFIYDERLVAGALRVLARENGRPVDESAVEGWLNEIYEGEIAVEWKEKYAKTAAEFDQAVVNILRPFQSDRDLEKQFDRLFDGAEVLPEDLLSDYEDLTSQGDYIRASELLVPISYQRLAQISQAQKRTSEKGERLITVDIPYSSEKGLDLSVLTKPKHSEDQEEAL